MEETKMTKEEFAQMERAQQKIWKELAESGEECKPDVVYSAFRHGCPACTIASKAFNNWLLGSVTVDINKHYCAFCPVSLWRESSELCPSCQGDCDNEIEDFAGTLEDISKLPLYGQWVILTNCSSMLSCSEEKLIEERKKVALEISKLEFSWLKEYEAVELEQVTKDYLKGEEEYGC
jgi:hypothetical protein